jgi:hypothetical protein
VPAVIENDTKSTYSEEFVGGIEYELLPSLNVGVRYVHRSIANVLEDYAQATPVMYYRGYPGLSAVTYQIDNIDHATPTLDPTGTPGFEDLGRSTFEDPVHKYDAIEVTANRTFKDNWSLLASYRYAKLRGNFEGFYSQIGGPEFGFRGDIRFQGNSLGEGKLPNERPHQLKLYANYAMGSLNLGAGLNAGSGRHLTALAANPIYSNSGEIPETTRGGGVETVDGFLENTGTEVIFDLHLDWTHKINNSQRIILLADVFNVFDDQDPTWYDVYTETVPGAANPNYGQPNFGGGASTNAFHLPRQIRLGARFEW